MINLSEFCAYRRLKNGTFFCFGSHANRDSSVKCELKTCPIILEKSKDKIIGKIFQHFKGGVYLVLNVTSGNVVNYMRLSDKQLFDKVLSEFTGNKELPNGEVVKRFRLLDGYSLVDGALNERERILDLIDREIECLECHAYADKTFGLCRAKKLIEKSAGD